MNVNYELYKIFYVVALNESISAACEKLHISQPAVSYQIKTLENILGITLFVRTKKGVTLTDEGKVLFNYVKTGIESFINGEHSLTNLKDLEYGTIRIGASTTVSKHVLMPYLKIFHERFPNIEIEIVNNLTSNLLTELRKGNLDALLLNMPMEESKDLKVFKIMDVQDVFVCDKKLFESTHGKLKLEELKNYPLLFQKRPSNTRDYLDKYLKNNKVTLKPKMEIVSYNLIMDFVKIGFGIGYATREFIKSEIDNKELYELDVTPSVPKRYIGMVTLNKTIPNYSLNKLINIIKENKAL